MASLPTISGRQAREAFIKGGWNFARQRGSHILLIKLGHLVSRLLPDHKELA